MGRHEAEGRDGERTERQDNVAKERRNQEKDETEKKNVRLRKVNCARKIYDDRQEGKNLQASI